MKQKEIELDNLDEEEVLPYNTLTGTFIEPGNPSGGGLEETPDIINDFELLAKDDTTNKEYGLSKNDNELLKKLTTLKKKYHPRPVCKIERNPLLKMKSGIVDILRVDDVRLVELCEMMFYAFFYGLFGFIIGTLINRIFPARSIGSNNFQILVEMLLQVVVVSVGIFYVQKFVNIIPSPFSSMKNYCPYIFTSAVSVVVLGVVIMSTQTTLMNKFELLARKFGQVEPLPFIGRLIS